MPFEDITETKQDFLSQEYVRQWRITQLSRMNNKVVRIPVVSPINVNVKFFLEILYQKIGASYSYNEISCFKVTLVKLFASEIQPDLKLEFEVAVNYTNGILLKEYKCLSGISVNEMDFVKCIDDTSNIYSHPGKQNLSSHGDAMASDALIVKLRMKFFGHLITPSVYCRDIRTLNNLKKFTEDLSTLWKTSGLSDITIQIGGKHLPAHRALLAAHSPVFMKMMDSDFLESKTNSITISDFSCDIFESFLKYLYSGEIEDKSWASVKELYVLADKYDVQTLKRQCAEIIGYILTVDRVCDILKFGYDYDDSELKKEATSFAVVHFHEIVHTVEWNEFVTSHPITGYEIMASVYFATRNVLESKEPVTLPFSFGEISPKLK